MCGLQREKGKKWDLRGQPWVCRPALNCSVARGVEKGLAPAVGPRGAGSTSSHGSLPTPWCFHQGAHHPARGVCALCAGRRNPTGAWAKVTASRGRRGVPVPSVAGMCCTLAQG